MKWLWILLIGALALVIAAEWYLPVQAPSVPFFTNPRISGDQKPNLLAEADRTADFPPMEQYQPVKDRPLFFEGRRPPAEYVPDEPKAKPLAPVRKVPPPRASLSGVIRIGDNTYVMLKGVGKEKGLLRVKVGEDVDGWQVEKIQDDRVVLNNAGEKHEIPLRSYKTVPLPRVKPPAKPGEKDKNRAQERKKALAARRERNKQPK